MELEKKELLKRLRWWKKAYIEKYKTQLPIDKTQHWDKFNEQAYQQIIAIINKPN